MLTVVCNPTPLVTPPLFSPPLPHSPTTSVSMHPSGLYVAVATSTRMYIFGILRSEMQSVAEFPLVGAGRVQFSVDGGKFAVSTNKQVRGRRVRAA
jgi:hypothetical protein